MSNALALLSRIEVEADEIQALIQAEAAGEEGDSYDFIPTKIKIGRDAPTFVTEGGESMREVLCVIPISQKARAYWPKTGESDTVPPLCTSPDGHMGIFNADPADSQIAASLRSKVPHPGAIMLAEGNQPPAQFDCKSCPLQQWGSADQGSGQACKAMLRLVVLVDGWSAPALLTLPPTSIRPFNTYASALHSQKSAYFAVRTTLKLEKKGSGQTAYNVISMSNAGPLNADEVKAVIELRKQAEEYVRNSAVEAGDYVNNVPTDEDTPF